MKNLTPSSRAKPDVKRSGRTVDHVAPRTTLARDFRGEEGQPPCQPCAARNAWFRSPSASPTAGVVADS
jgi:hypothetical protein